MGQVHTARLQRPQRLHADDCPLCHSRHGDRMDRRAEDEDGETTLQRSTPQRPQLPHAGPMLRQLKV